MKPETRNLTWKKIRPPSASRMIKKMICRKYSLNDFIGLLFEEKKLLTSYRKKRKDVNANSLL
jgi:hypothetical protein